MNVNWTYCDHFTTYTNIISLFYKPDTLYVNCVSAKEKKE